MRIKLVMTLVLCCLFSTQLLAQRKELPALRSGPDQHETNATFAIGVSRDNGNTFITQAGESEILQISGALRPEPVHIGQLGKFFLITRLNGVYQMLNNQGQFVPWNFIVRDLVPFQSDVVMKSEHIVNFYQDKLTGMSGNLFIFIGYKAPGSNRLYYNSHALKLEVLQQTPREQALAMFNSNISPNILQSRCITCHVSGGQASFFSAYTLLRSTSANHLDSNFSTYETLLASTGKATILSKASGGSGHLGGVQLTTSSQEYKDLDSFLTLLGQ